MTTTSRAHRRFLRQLAPGNETWDCTPITELHFQAHLKVTIDQHLATAGIPRGGPVLGYRGDQTLTVTHLLPATTPGLSAGADPMTIDPSYLLGAIDALRTFGHPRMDWIGQWYMAADGLETDEMTDLLVWNQARRFALVGPCNTLLLFGQGETKTAIHAYVGGADTISALDIHWTSREEA